MKPRRTPLCTLLPLASGLLIGTGSAHGDFIGVVAQAYEGDGWAENGYEGLRTLRLFANFTPGDPDDGVVSVIGLHIESSEGVFHNDPQGGLTAPPDLRPEVWSNQWDTYVTINATSSTDDATTTTPGFATETNDLGASWTSKSAGWFVTPEDAQSRVNVNRRVFLGQFVIPCDDFCELSGSVELLFRNGQVVTEELDGCAANGQTTECGCISFASILAVLGNWGNTGRQGDGNCDRYVDFQDIVAVLSHYVEFQCAFPTDCDADEAEGAGLAGETTEAGDTEETALQGPPAPP